MNRKYFARELVTCLHTEHRVSSVDQKGSKATIDGREFDYVLNCTYNQFSPVPDVAVVYEVCLMLVYERSTPGLDFALTVMDGRFGSLYPFCARDGKSLYTLSSVQHTAVSSHVRIEEAQRNMETLPQTDWCRTVRDHFENVLLRHAPWFNDSYEYAGEMWSIKTKLSNNNGDTRECVVRRCDRVIHAFSGKISNVFFAEDRIRGMIGIT